MCCVRSVCDAGKEQTLERGYLRFRNQGCGLLVKRKGIELRWIEHGVRFESSQQGGIGDGALLGPRKVFVLSNRAAEVAQCFRVWGGLEGQKNYEGLCHYLSGAIKAQSATKMDMYGGAGDVIYGDRSIVINGLRKKKEEKNDRKQRGGSLLCWMSMETSRIRRIRRIRCRIGPEYIEYLDSLSLSMKNKKKTIIIIRIIIIYLTHGLRGLRFCSYYGNTPYSIHA